MRREELFALSYIENSLTSNGVLAPLATREPGFTVDGPVEELGTKLILPPFLEPRRAEIAARLTPLPDPRADRASSGAAPAPSA